ncbi:catalase, partial [Rhizobium ruizarguesonis]
QGNWDLVGPPLPFFFLPSSLPFPSFLPSFPPSPSPSFPPSPSSPSPFFSFLPLPPSLLPLLLFFLSSLSLPLSFLF